MSVARCLVLESRARNSCGTTMWFRLKRSNSNTVFSDCEGEADRDAGLANTSGNENCRWSQKFIGPAKQRCDAAQMNTKTNASSRLRWDGMTARIIAPVR